MIDTGSWRNCRLKCEQKSEFEKRPTTNLCRAIVLRISFSTRLITSLLIEDRVLVHLHFFHYYDTRSVNLWLALIQSVVNLRLSLAHICLRTFANLNLLHR